ncbi:MAG: PAS domain S-box protein [Nevskia sp.]|nr:PAS domain S-box protein [Nevskia sp.]
MSTTTTGREATLARGLLSVGRDRILLMTAILVGLLMLTSALALPAQPRVMAWEPRAFVASGSLMLLTALLFSRRRMPYRLAAALTIGISIGMMLLRVAMIFIDDTFADGTHSLFMPVYAYYTVVYLMLAILLPDTASMRASVAAWLALASLVTVGSLSLLHAGPPRPFLMATLIYVWLGHGLFVALLLGWTRQQRALVEAHARLAEMERAERLSALASEQRFRVVFEQSTAGVGLIGADGCWQIVNGRMAELTGYTLQELQGMSLMLLLVPEAREAARQRLGNFINSEQPRYAVEQQWLRRDGGLTWVSLNFERVPGSAELPAAAVVMAVDISARKQAEQEAQELQRIRDFHLDNTPLAVIEWTPDWRIRRWSLHATEMFGWTEAEVLGKNAFEWRFVHDEDLARVGSFAQTMIEGQASNYQTINRNYHRDGRAVWCQWHNSVLRSDSGDVLSILSMASDVSQEQETLVALRDSQARFQAIFDQVAAGIGRFDAEGRWLELNTRMAELLGYPAAELIGQPMIEVTPPEDHAPFRARMAQLLAGPVPDYSMERRAIRKDGSVIWLQVQMRKLATVEGEPAQGVLLAVDISERKQAEAQVQRLNADLEKRVTERTRQLKDTIGSWVERNRELNLLTEMTGLLTAAADSGAANRIVGSYLPRLFKGYGGAVWLGDSAGVSFPMVAEWGSRLAVPATLLVDDCWGLRRGQLLRIDDPAHPQLCPHLDGRPDGHEPHTCVPVTALGSPVGLIHLGWSERIGSLVTPPDETLLSSVSEQIGLAISNVRLREELRRQAIRDPLTGLYNRRHFDELLRARMAEHDRSERGFSILMIDIDHFKRINDQHGHEVGDQVLSATARHLQASVRAGEAAFRFGGEEFVLLIDDGEHPDGSQAMQCGERIRREIAELRVHSGDCILPPVTVSIGVAGYPRDVERKVSPLQRADAALYIAKRTGRNRVCSAGAVPGQEVAVGLVSR